MTRRTSEFDNRFLGIDADGRSVDSFRASRDPSAHLVLPIRVLARGNRPFRFTVRQSRNNRFLLRNDFSSLAIIPCVIGAISSISVVVAAGMQPRPGIGPVLTWLTTPWPLGLFIGGLAAVGLGVWRQTCGRSVLEVDLDRQVAFARFRRDQTGASHRKMFDLRRIELRIHPLYTDLVVRHWREFIGPGPGDVPLSALVMHGEDGVVVLGIQESPDGLLQYVAGFPDALRGRFDNASGATVWIGEAADLVFARGDSRPPADIIREYVVAKERMAQFRMWDLLQPSLWARQAELRRRQRELKRRQ